jgi:uncharacterized protein YjbI with pentapeptide repeats
MVGNQQLNEELRQVVIKAQQHPANTKMRQMKRRFIDAINETFSSFVKPSNCCNKRLGNENLEQLVVSDLNPLGSSRVVMINYLILVFNRLHSMKHKKIASVILLASILIAYPTSAQNKENSRRELYILCSKFPLNSQCKGLEIPIPLDERSGEEAGCSLLSGNSNQSGKCKVVATEESLTVYLEDEEGEPIEFLDNQLPSLEIKIFFETVFAQNYQIWNKVHRLEFGYLVKPDSNQGNRTKFLTILTNENIPNSLNTQLSLTPTSAELLSQSQVNTLSNFSSPVQRLLETKECIRCDLRGADLAGANLNEANLEGASLQGANLQGTTLVRAYLVGANLSQANLTEAVLTGSNLTLASLTESSLEGADLSAANLQGANLQLANLKGAKLIAPTLIQDADLRNTNLEDANIQGANLERANLEGANLQGANLSDISIRLQDIPGNYSFGEFLLDLAIGFPISNRGTKFYTNLRNVNLRNATLTGVNLEDALLDGADLSNANLSEAKLNDVDLSGANLCGATMSDGSTSNLGC